MDMAEMLRDTASERQRPTTSPASTSESPCLTTRRSTSAGRAPRAMRMPISCVRCATEYAMTL